MNCLYTECYGSLNVLQTIPCSSPLEVTPAGSNMSSTSTLGSKDTVFVDKTSSGLHKSNVAGKCVDSSGSSLEMVGGAANMVLKSEGVPTRYEKIDGGVGCRVEEEVAEGEGGEQKLDTGNLKSNSTSNRVHSSTRGMEPVPEAKNCSTSRNIPESPGSVFLEVPNAPRRQARIRQGDGGSKDSNLSGSGDDSDNDPFSPVGRSQSMCQPSLLEKDRVQKDVYLEESPQQGPGDAGIKQFDYGKFLVRMKSLGHRRSSSAPIKSSHRPTPFMVMAGGMIKSEQGNSVEEPLAVQEIPLVSAFSSVLLC